MSTDQGLLLNHRWDFANLPNDRIFYVSSTNDAQFTTQPITIPATGLYLNAAVSGSAFVRAELLDGSGQVIPGFDSGGLLIENQDGSNLPLAWKWRRCQPAGWANGPAADLPARCENLRHASRR